MNLTIVTCGRNDNFAGNFLQRLEHNLNKLSENIEKLGLENEVEIIVTDWGSPDDSKISDVIKVDKKNFIKYLHVPYDLTIKYSPNSSFSLPHAMNAAVRRMSGRYMLSLDADSYVPLETFKGVYDLILNDNSREYTFYWGSRYFIPYKTQIEVNNIQEMDELIKKWSDSGKPTVRQEEMSNGWVHSKIYFTNNMTAFSGGACALLINKEIAQSSNFLFEALTKWGWCDCEIHERLSTKYKCFGDLEDISGDFFHIGHHEVKTGQDLHGWNPTIKANTFAANGENWGLGSENLIFYK